MAQDRLRHHFDFYLGKPEIVSHLLHSRNNAGSHGLCDYRNRWWTGLSRWTVAAQTLRVLNQLLIMLMLVEILTSLTCSGCRTVSGGRTDCRNPVHSGDYPGSSHAHQRRSMGDRKIERDFHSAMIELDLLGLLVLVLVTSITLLRRYPPVSKDLPEPDTSSELGTSLLQVGVSPSRHHPYLFRPQQRGGRHFVCRSFHLDQSRAACKPRRWLD
jgi:hypothetical protein